MQESNAARAVMRASQSAEASGVASHIRTASKATGVSFDYLMAQAGKESAFVADAKSRASSAAGLFQFTKGTWLQLVKLHGAAHGLGAQAEQIERNGRGEFVVKDPEQRQKILALRRDPALSSLIAGEYAKDNKHWLEKSLGRKVGATELYLAHFLGPAGAVKLLKAKAEDPQQPAADLVPQAAAKNRTMFYESDQSAQSVAALYDHVKQVMENPAHPPRRQIPPAELAVAALRYGDLPWAAGTEAEPLLANMRWSVQAYTGVAQSADRISAPMPPSPSDSRQLLPDDVESPAADPAERLFKALFG